MRLPQAGETWTPKTHNINVPVHGFDTKGRNTVVIKPGQPVRIIEVLGPPSNDPEPAINLRIEVKGITVDVWMSTVYIEPLL